jgi:hypothetical protein
VSIQGFRRHLALCCVPIAIAVATALPAQAATHYQRSGTFTAYAMGNLYGYSPTSPILYPGDAAVHPQSTPCSTNCIPVVPFGTNLFLMNGDYVPIRVADGSVGEYHVLTVWDLGDYEMSRSYWWVDAYFGRWRRSTSEPCSCGGVSGYCYIGNTNSCTNAQNFGVNTFSYEYWL